MTRNRTILAVVAAALASLVWYVALFGPASSQRERLGEQVSAAEDQEEELRSTLVRLRRLEGEGGAQQRAQLERLRRLVPAQPDVAGFILAANHVAVGSGVDWISIAPAAPVAGEGGGPNAIGVSIAVNGGFFTTVDYLRRLEGLERLVVVDSLQLSPGGQAEGPLQLSATISARIFTTAAAALPPGSPAAPSPAPDGEGGG